MHPIKALIWKEWRECRTFAIVVVSLMLLVRIVWPYLHYFIPDVSREDWNFSKGFTGGLIFPVISLFIVLFSSFYYELKNNTVSFLLIKPISTAKIFWVKYLFGFLVWFSLFLLSLGIFDMVGELYCKFSSASDLYKFVGFSTLLCICIYTYFFTCLFVHRIKMKGNLLLSFSSLFLGLITILHIIASVIAITLDFEKTFIVLLIILATISLFSGFAIWQKKISKDASPIFLLVKISVALLIFSVLFFLTLDIYAGWKLKRITREAETAGLKVNLEDLNKLTDEEKKSDELYQKAFALKNKINAKYGDYSTVSSFIKKNGKSPEELLSNDPDFKEMLETMDEIIAIPHRRFRISFDERGLNKESDELAGIACILGLYIEPILTENKYDESVSLCQKLSKLLDGAPEIPAHYMHVRLSGSENWIAKFLLKLPSEKKYVEQFRFSLSRLDKTSSELPEKMIQDSVSNYYARANTLLTGRYQRGSLIKENKKILEYLLINYLGRPCIKKVLYRNIAFSIRQSHLFRIDDTAEILKVMNEDSHQFLLDPSLRESYYFIAKSKIYVDLNRQALALKIYKAEHGEYPDKLDEIVPGILPKLPTDYFSEKNFIYRKKGEGFTLYSIGQNKKDDEGLNHGIVGLYIKGKDDITCTCEN